MSKFMKQLNSMYDRTPITEGIYFSKVTGKIFEALKKRKKMKITYTEDGTDGPDMSPVVFYIQNDVLGYYELLIPYEGK